MSRTEEPLSRTSSESAPMSARRATWIALGLALALAVFWSWTLPRSPAMGWDESMHAALPAARMWVALRAGEFGRAFDALLGCSQYPFAYPCLLALVQGICGLSEHVVRVTGIAVWCATLFGVFLLAREVLRRFPAERAPRNANSIPWIAMGLAALSPLALDFAGTVFLEVPFTCASVYALRAWLVSARARNSKCDYAAGAWIALALYTKWNYGLLFGAGLAFDAVFELVAAARASRLPAQVERLVRVASIPAIVSLWWFVLPLPGGFEIASEHRRAFVEFLGGNLELARVPAAYRVLFATTWLVITPRLFAMQLAALFVSLRRVRAPSVRCVWLVFVCGGVPVWFHPFHQDRFLVPSVVGFALLAAIGLATLLPSRPVARVATLAGLAAIALLFVGRDTLWIADALGVVQKDPTLRAYQENIFAQRGRLGTARALPTGPSLERSEEQRILDLIAAEAQPNERVAWIGTSSDLSPAVLHLGLLARGGTIERFLADAEQPLDVTYFGTDPHWDDARLLEFANTFDVLFFTDPTDLRLRSSRAFLRGYRERLLASGAYEAHEIARDLAIARPPSPPLAVTLFACRRKAK